MVFFFFFFCRICHDTDKWDLQGKYSKRFSKAGVKLRTTTFDVWMDFAANRGTFDCSIEELPVQVLFKIWLCEHLMDLSTCHVNVVIREYRVVVESR